MCEYVCECVWLGEKELGFLKRCLFQSQADEPCSGPVGVLVKHFQLKWLVVCLFVLYKRVFGLSNWGVKEGN